MSDQAKCELCGEPMPPGEEMFKMHGYSGNCPKPPLQRTRLPDMRFVVTEVETNCGPGDHFVQSRVVLRRTEIASGIQSLEWCENDMPPKPGTIVVVSMRIES